MDVGNNTLVTSASQGPSASGTGFSKPAIVSQNLSPSGNFMPRVPLRALVSPVGADGRPDPNSTEFFRSGGSIIARENGKRFIAVKFSVQNRDLASTVDEVGQTLKEAKVQVGQKSEPLFKAPYWMQMGGEFEQMSDAETRLIYIIPASLAGIFLLLYLAFRSMLDAVVVLSNVLFSIVGGIWALYIMDVNFSVSAAVGFVSLFGVAIMDGLLLISYFNDARRKGLDVHSAIMQGAEMRIRPTLITDLTAFFGLLPAVWSTEIGAQTQRPLSIVVVGGMVFTVVLTRFLMPVLYSFYGHRKPPADASCMSH